MEAPQSPLQAERPLYGLRYKPLAQWVRVAQKLPYMSLPAARAIYKNLMSGYFRWQDIAFIACNDRFFLLTCLLRRPDALHPWIYSRCREVEADPDDHLDLWARYHYKSTIVTFAGAMQEIIRDPEITIAIFSVTKAIAKPFIQQLKEEMEQNPLLPIYFPDVFWADKKEAGQRAQKWSIEDGITVKREGNPREATVEAHGLLDAMPTGKHFKLRIYDDVINEKVTTQTDTDQAKRATLRWEMSQNLGTKEGGRKWHVGTRYHFGDTYGVLISRQILKTRTFPATENGKLDGKPVFLSAEAWAKVRKEQRGTIAAQMLQNPLAGSENTFRIEQLRGYVLRPRRMMVYILVDPSKGRGKRSDRTAMPVIGIDSNKNRYLLDGFCHRMRLSERHENLDMLYEKWSKANGVYHVSIGYESYGLQTDTEYMEEKFLDAKKAPEIVEVNWARTGGQSKTDRIQRLEPYFRDGSFLIPAKVYVPNLGVCTWEARENQAIPDWYPIPAMPVRNRETGEVTGTRPALLKQEREALERGEPWRITDPIRRINEDGEIYDLTVTLIEEYVNHPFSPRDDLIDACSRIEDMEPVGPPEPTMQADLMPAGFDD